MMKYKTILATLCLMAILGCDQGSILAFDENDANGMNARLPEDDARVSPRSSLLGTWVSVSNGKLSQVIQISEITATTLFILQTDVQRGSSGWATVEVDSPDDKEVVVQYYGRSDDGRLVFVGPTRAGGRLIVYAQVNDEVASSYEQLKGSATQEIYQEWVAD